MFKKYEVCQKKCAGQIIVEIYNSNEFYLDSTSESNVTYLSHLFSACIDPNKAGLFEGSFVNFRPLPPSTPSHIHISRRTNLISI